ncbi:MAG: hypothetical protein AAF086_05365 [Planctomycetota bacterium]
MRIAASYLLSLAVGWGSLGCAAGVVSLASADEPATRITVTPEVLNPVDDRLFGQFMEVASWGEPGPDAIVDPSTGALPEDVVDLLASMRTPVVRDGILELKFPAQTVSVVRVPRASEDGSPRSSGA